MLRSVRVLFWTLAVLGNVVAAWLVWNGLSGLWAGAHGEGALAAAGAMMGGSVVLIYAFAFSLIPTALALAVDRLTRT